MSPVQVIADTDRCIGAGQCVLTAGHLFDQDEDGIVQLLTGTVDTEGDVALARQAEHLCPAAALKIQPVAGYVAGNDATQGQLGA